MFTSSRLSRPALRHVVYATVISLSLTVLYYNTGQLRSSLIEFDDVPIDVWETRAKDVKEAFLHAYQGYEKYAAPSDELLPLSDSRVNNFNGWGVTAFDSLDTMLLMGLDNEYKRALAIVRQANFTHSETVPVPYFETIIRYLGGLLRDGHKTRAHLQIALRHALFWH
ncbi:hypothetical protein AX14_008936 [Amanita brunnescens Koide BX004]|nr:hypothetical protein AX14_008936 [Amanita brunnescens Koide BX004]